MGINFRSSNITFSNYHYVYAWDGILDVGSNRVKLAFLCPIECAPPKMESPLYILCVVLMALETGIRYFHTFIETLFYIDQFLDILVPPHLSAHYSYFYVPAND